jgi:membrane fusion protein, heavy metal efflux system
MKRFVLILLTCALIASCSPKTAEVAIKPAQAAGAPVRIVLNQQERQQVKIALAPVIERILPLEVQASGQVQSAADRSTQVSAAVPGRVERVNVQLGQRVSAGEILAVLRSDEVAQIQSDLLQQVLDIESEREQDQVQLNLAKSTFEREKQLLAEKVGTRADFEQAKSEYLKAAAALRGLERKRGALITTASERLRLLGVPASEGERVIRERRIDNTVVVRSPRSGIVAERNINPGELSDNSKPLFAIADPGQVWLVAQIFEKDIPLVKIGLPATVRLDSYPGQAFAGRLNYVAPSLDPTTRTLAVRATIDNPNGKLKPQMFARLTLPTGSLRALAVPAAAVQKSGETYVAYLQVGENTYEERRLTLGHTLGTFVEVKSGLSLGQQVVVAGSVELQGRAIQMAGQ